MRGLRSDKSKTRALESLEHIRIFGHVLLKRIREKGPEQAPVPLLVDDLPNMGGFTNLQSCLMKSA